MKIRALALSGLTWMTCLAAPAFGGAVSESFELGPWEAHLVDEITPRLERLHSPPPPPVSWLALDQRLLAPEFAQTWMGSPGPQISPSIRLAWVEPRWGVSEQSRLSLLSQERSRIEQSMMMPGVRTQVTANSAVTVAAVLASQRYVSLGMNTMAYEGAVTPIQGRATDLERVESSHGLGLRVSNQFEPYRHVLIETAYQSRIDMNPLATLQGVHGAQAQLDIPSRLEADVRWQVTPRLVSSVGVSHIFYSEVGAFPSRAMPARFSALLGDSTSPEFAWRDLTVFRMGLGFAVTETLTAELEYNSRAQPDPTVQALSDALGGEVKKHAWRVGMTQTFSERARFHVGAAYAPPEYVFGGHILGVVSDELKQNFEVQALWQVFF